VDEKAATFTVANLYYNQPVLNKIAETFDVSFEKASSVATLMQSGYAAGLLFICPVGDILRRRPFILGLIWFTATVVSQRAIVSQTEYLTVPSGLDYASRPHSRRFLPFPSSAVSRPSLPS
jgi:predicted MFS family arabinose efflux permease